MKKGIYNAANLTSLIRIAATPILIYMIFNFPTIPTVIFFCLIALTDAVDGFIAKRFNQTTDFGKTFDQVADRIFFVSIMIALAIKFSGMINYFVPLLFREIISVSGNIIFILKKKPLAVPVKLIGKLTTTLQFITLPMLLLGWKIAVFFVILTAISGVFSGITYVKEAIKA